MSVATLSSLIYDAALALVYPQVCAICGASVESRHDGVVCAACWQTTRVFTQDDTLCWKCGQFTEAAISHDRRQSVRCGRCDEESFTGARACGFYEGALRASILELKREPHVPNRLARLLSDVLRREPINSADLIVPVPLHPKRERERGFNQALLLARELARLGGLPLVIDTNWDWKKFAGKGSVREGWGLRLELALGPGHLARPSGRAPLSHLSIRALPDGRANAPIQQGLAQGEGPTLHAQNLSLRTFSNPNSCL